jgi:hypothetical protein
LDKLAYDPAVGQIACTASGWARSVEPTGIRDLGTPCGAAELNTTLASTPDAHLIYCPATDGVWMLYQP